MAVNRYFQGNKFFSYFDLTNQFQNGNHITNGLLELTTYYSNRLSFRGVEELLTRITGCHTLSSKHISNIVSDLAFEISECQLQEVNKILSDSNNPFPKINTDFDIYDSKIEEVIISEDGIQVKGQKLKHDNIPLEKSSPRINTNVFLISKPDNTYQYLMSGINRAGNDIVSFEDLIISSFRSLYSRTEKPLNIVAITDGASTIRCRLLNIFQVQIIHILDWYHLEKKVGEYLSMLHFMKSDKEKHFSFITNKLWSGNVSDAISYLNTLSTDNLTKLSELIGYLEKHRREIINYDRRQSNNKSIGSGRMEKAVDDVIGHRQKKKGMSWHKIGSKSLGLLKVIELNGLWNKLWEDKVA